MKRTRHKKAFRLIKQIFIGLLINIVNASSHTKLHRCVGSCNILNDWSNKVWIPNKVEDLNLL